MRFWVSDWNSAPGVSGVGERVSGGLPRTLAHTRISQQFHQPKSFAGHSAWSAAYALLGWLPAVRFIPCKAYAADQAWVGHDRLESPNPRVTYLECFINSPVILE